MKKAIIAVAISVLVAFCCMNVTAAADYYDTIDSYLEGQMKQAAIPNLSLGIVKDGKIVYLQSYGEGSHGISGAKNDIYAIGSVSKTFTALCVRQLIENGKIDENSSISHYLPDFRAIYNGNDADITVGQLLQHTSGISKLTGGAPYLYNERYSLQEVVDRSLRITLVHSPGTVYEYSNLNYLILGRLVEIVSGQSYNEYINEWILTPLKMTNTFPSISELHGKDYMKPFLPFYGGTIPVYYPISEGITPTGGFFSTAEDLCKWMICYQQGGYINEQTLIVNNSVSSMQSAENDVCYSIYWTAVKKADTQTICHNGTWPGYSSSVLVDTASGYGVVVLTNSFDQSGVSSSAPTPWSMSEDILTFLKTDSFPDQKPITWNYSLLIWVAILILGMTAFAVFMVRREIRCSSKIKGMRKIITWATVFFAVPALWLIIVPLVNDCGWKWLLASNPNVNISILFIMAVLVLTGIGTGIVMFINCIQTLKHHKNTTPKWG